MRAALNKRVLAQHMQVLTADKKCPLPDFVVHGQRTKASASQVGQCHGTVHANGRSSPVSPSSRY